MKTFHKAALCAALTLGLSANAFADDIADMYIKWANEGNVVYQADLAECYLKGKRDLPKDADKAIYWYKKAAEQGKESAFYGLGEVYNYMLKDYPTAIYWYKRAATAGYEPSYAALSNVYDFEAPPELRSKGKQLYWSRRAAAYTNDDIWRNDVKELEAEGVVAIPDGDIGPEPGGGGTTAVAATQNKKEVDNSTQTSRTVTPIEKTNPAQERAEVRAQQSECSECDGTQKQACIICQETGKRPCMMCAGRGSQMHFAGAMGMVNRPCAFCSGTAKTKCSACSGTKKVPCATCRKDWWDAQFINNQMIIDSNQAIIDSNNARLNSRGSGGGGSSSGSRSRSSSSCNLCNGTGKYLGDYRTDYSGNGYVKSWCSICQQTMEPHSHKKCPSCGGSGRN